MKTLKDVSVNVVSAKAETIGKAAHDVFAVTYHGEPLNSPMELLVVNALYYYLARAEVEREERLGQLLQNMLSLSECY